MDELENKPKFGVWLPGIGWLKVNSIPLAFDLKEVAESTASRISSEASVEFIDQSLVDLENQLLEAERKELANLEEEIKFELERKQILEDKKPLNRFLKLWRNHGLFK